mmetsp:Transcript_40658/g.49486  ORF Transcript_40658/g.49486 Transcript_40658/m.49486 type:complete len:534 (+) Transcript_40658:181-1782(+)|eukprot:CAMPEP_0172506358 /NCGR_PEP_ID=MMETSP1066-20121228/194357_1 /TAXON_ID=671091 /ORGANISM="Coscinodiscus wailesii, Strain CCMP2513" /LENGTH=533 /DNA_ID=CAMNT_0013283359 /DNA_START=158 /DNA_END=1759 /DNA_ORIENTATION=+
MLVLFETPAGYSLFKVSNEKKISKTSPEDIHDKFFSTSDSAKSHLDMISFQSFADTADAVSASTAIMEGKLSKSLKSFIKKKILKQLGGDTGGKSKKGGVRLAIADKNLAVSIKEKFPSLEKSLVHDAVTHELFRGIREHMDELMGSDSSSPQHVTAGDLRAMQLGLSHSLSRYKLKFSADKVDTMVIQAVGLLDELDKEINTYAMRVKEWYGWHFPELQAIVSDNAQYAKIVLECGYRKNIKDTDVSHVLEDESVAQAVKDAAEVSMGTDIDARDVTNMKALAEQVLDLTHYRSQLFEYLKNRMNAIAPNLTILVGELVGARLISHAGSLINLAKQPASTVQILGAEKALFRALKTKHDTPKYGLIYHASLVGQATPKNKGKISRVLAAKAALAIRVDALSDETHGAPDTTIGFEGRAKVEARLRDLEGGGAPGVNTDGRLTTKTARYSPAAVKAEAKPAYNVGSDVVMEDKDVEGGEDGDKKTKKEKKEKKKKKEKRKAEEITEEEDDEAARKAAKKAAKKAKKEKRKSKE